MRTQSEYVNSIVVKRRRAHIIIYNVTFEKAPETKICFYILCTYTRIENNNAVYTL